MRCCIVRHGETSWNADRRLQGHQDVPLNELGLAQAEAAGRYLLNRHQQTPYAAIVSSDLMRARQTADEIAHALGMAVVSDPGLRERHYGQFEGKTQTEAEAQNPADYAALVARAELDAAPGGAEPLQGMLERIERSLWDLASQQADHAVILVTHGGVLDLLYRRAMGRPLTGPRDAPIPNAGLNWLDIEAEEAGLRWTMVAWGKTEHLTGASRDEIL